MTNLQASETFAAVGAGLSATAAVGTGAVSGVSSSSSNFGGGVSLAYDVSNGSYTVRAGGASMSFAAADRHDFQSNEILSIYEKQVGNRSDQLVLFNPGSGNTQLALTYVSYGAWQTIVNTASSVDFDQQFFVYGIRQAANAPSTGSGSYATRVDGFWTGSAGLYSLSGTSSFTADFGAMTVATNLNLTGTDILDNSAVPATRSLGQFNGTGTIAALGGGFSGSFQHQGTDAGGTTYSGGFNGAFFGPTGSEMGYTFRLTGSNGAAVGAVVGKAN